MYIGRKVISLRCLSNDDLSGLDKNELFMKAIELQNARDVEVKFNSQRNDLALLMDSRLLQFGKSIDDKLSALVIRIDEKLSAQEIRIDSKLSALDGKLSSLEIRMDDKFNAIDRKISGLEVKLSDIETRLVPLTNVVCVTLIAGGGGLLAVLLMNIKWPSLVFQ
jgi:hypothetical protein